MSIQKENNVLTYSNGEYIKLFGKSKLDMTRMDMSVESIDCNLSLRHYKVGSYLLLQGGQSVRVCV